MSLYHFQCIVPLAIAFIIGGIAYLCIVERGGRK